MYVDGHALALNLDIDRIRGLLGRWQDDATEAGRLTRALGLAAARSCFEARTDRGEDPAHTEAGALVGSGGGRTELAAMYDRLLHVQARRPSTQVVQTRAGSVADAYAAVLAVVDGTA